MYRGPGWDGVGEGRLASVGARAHTLEGLECAKRIKIKGMDSSTVRGAQWTRRRTMTASAVAVNKYDLVSIGGGERRRREVMK